MRSEELLEALRKAFQKFRPTLWFRIVYLVLLGVIVAELYVFTFSSVACLIIFLIPFTVFIVPYWLGERRARGFVGNGLLVFLVAILVVSTVSTLAVLGQADPVPLRSVPGFQSAAGLNLSNGSVMPYRGTPGQTFTFRVNLTTNRDSTPNAYNVSLNLTAVDGFTVTATSHAMSYSPGSSSSSNPRNGTWYEVNVTLGGSVYLYSFSATDRDRNWTVTIGQFLSTGEIGPVTASGPAFFGFFIYLAFLTGPLPIEFLLYLSIVFLWWYMRRARATRDRMRSAGSGSPKPTPTVGPEPGSRVSKTASFTCTNCGADVSESDEKCPSCGAVFED